MKATLAHLAGEGWTRIDDSRGYIGLGTGDRFLVVGDKDVIVLKNLSPPSLDEFDTLIAEARNQARYVGLKKSDIEKAVREARKER